MDPNRDEKGRFKKKHRSWNKGMKRTDWISEEKEKIRRELISNSLKRLYKSGERRSIFKGNNYRDLPDQSKRIREGYVWIKVNGTWVQEHRYVWLKDSEWGFIPNGFNVHHIDGNKTNNNISNLACIPLDYHQYIHNYKGGG